MLPTTTGQLGYTNHLLLIGIDNYVNHNKLNDCVNDVKSFKKVLLSKYAFYPNNVREFYDDTATNKNIQDVLINFANTLDVKDNLVIYFSGHGSIKTDRGFWVPFDGAKNDYTTWLANDTIITLIHNINTKHIFLIADCCFSLSLLMTEPSKAYVEYMQFASRWALTSGRGLTYDGPLGGNSQFAKSLIRCLSKSNSDVLIGRLIDSVKTDFASSNLQAPQGYPLKDSNHQGGEFIFNIVEDNLSEDTQIKGNKDFLKILQLYKMNAKFREIVKYEDKSIGIGYQIFEELDIVLNNKTIFLCLYEGINQQRTHLDIIDKHQELFKQPNFIILVAKERKQTNPEIRKRNISDRFKPLNIFYIDDFIRDQCTPRYPESAARDSFLGIPNFIIPSFIIDNKIFNDEKYFENWISIFNEPLLVLKGTGGIGKTTFAQFIADRFQKQNPMSKVIYIDTKEILNELVKIIKRHENPNVYNFYEALCEKSGSISSKLSEDLFRLNLDAGNLLLGDVPELVEIY